MLLSQGVRSHQRQTFEHLQIHCIALYYFCKYVQPHTCTWSKVFFSLAYALFSFVRAKCSPIAWVSNKFCSKTSIFYVRMMYTFYNLCQPQNLIRKLLFPRRAFGVFALNDLIIISTEIQETLRRCWAQMTLFTFSAHQYPFVSNRHFSPIYTLGWLLALAGQKR